MFDGFLRAGRGSLELELFGFASIAYKAVKFGYACKLARLFPQHFTIAKDGDGGEKGGRGQLARLMIGRTGIINDAWGRLLRNLMAGVARPKGIAGQGRIAAEANDSDVFQ